MRKAGIWGLRGKVVTMNGDGLIIPDGILVIEQEWIIGVFSPDKVPAEYAGIEVIVTAGVIYPGMIDLHNHLAYNVIPLWDVPERFENRNIWRAREDYKSDISGPVTKVINNYQHSVNCAVRYVDAKPLIGGVTTGQGMALTPMGGPMIYQGAMRNVERPGSKGLWSAKGWIPDITPDKVESFREEISDPDCKAYLYHLCEGRDEESRKNFFNLKAYGFLRPNLVGVHSVSLRTEDFAEVRAAGAKIVWSPFSNLLLYGQTLDLNAVKDSGITFSIGSDWSPSGSKNLLQELKVAYQVNLDQGNVFTEEELVRAVTTVPAEILNWNETIGTIEPRRLCDLVVLEALREDVWLNMIFACEKNILLVLVDGVARIGSPDIMANFPAEEHYPMEDLEVAGKIKKLYLYHPESPLNHIPFNYAKKELARIMLDLNAFQQDPDPKELKTFSFSREYARPEFRMILDQEDDTGNNPLMKGITTVAEYELILKEPPKPIKNSIILDDAVVGGIGYMKTIASQLNLPESVKAILAKFYE